MKWSFLRASRIWGARSSSRMHSRHSVQSRSRSETIARRLPPAKSSMSKQLIGHLATRLSARSSSTSPRMSIRGSSRYHAVATGDHLACPRSPKLFPFTQCISMSISCPGRRRATRMSEWTGSGRSDAKSSSCFPKGSHCSCEENTFPLIGSWFASPPGAFLHLTWSLNLITSFSLTGPVLSTAFVSGDGQSNFSGSILIGIRPRRCARSSSCSTPVLFITNTFSMAMVGSSALRMRRSALANATSSPDMSIVMSSSTMVRILILKPSFQVFMSQGMSSGNVPRL
mmetsp:Transcript_44203/g.105248  ORF Transcript_44203/g.105248 Transcript_44203/m.105248 type:complete len:285 (+) Transcript_44203:300-1154(+)